MENTNVIAQVGATEIANAAAATITDKTTLEEVLSLLSLEPGQKKPDKTPTPKKLRTSFEQIANMKDCVIFDNGFVYYNNGCNHSVIWLPYCVSFTYHFNPLKESEKGTMNETSTLKEGLLEQERWYIAATLIAEHRIERNMDTNAGIGHSDVPDYEDEEDEANIDSYSAQECRSYFFMWEEDPYKLNPLDAVCRRETREEALAALTEKQREALIYVYRDGYTQEETAKKLGVSR